MTVTTKQTIKTTTTGIKVRGNRDKLGGFNFEPVHDAGAGIRVYQIGGNGSRLLTTDGRWSNYTLSPDDALKLAEDLAQMAREMGA